MRQTTKSAAKGPKLRTRYEIHLTGTTPGLFGDPQRQRMTYRTKAKTSAEADGKARAWARSIGLSDVRIERFSNPNSEER